MTIDERLEALTMNLELLSREREKDSREREKDGETKSLLAMARQDGENIRGLARIAEIHQEEHKQLEEERRQRDDAHREEHKDLDKRIAELVSGIGAFIAAQGKRKSE